MYKIDRRGGARGVQKTFFRTDPFFLKTSKCFKQINIGDNLYFFF